MITNAKKIDPTGEYLLVKDGDYSKLSAGSFDLILSAFTFDNIKMDQKPVLFSGLVALLRTNGVFANLVSSPEMYTHEWASFSTKEYPQNRQAKTGDVVPIITTDFKDRRPCYDIFCTDKDYRIIYQEVGLDVLDVLKPLATGDEPYEWVNETRIAAWTIYVLRKN